MSEWRNASEWLLEGPSCRWRPSASAGLAPEEWLGHEWLGYLRQCCTCRHIGPLDDFPRNRGKPSGHGHECRPCANERSRGWYFRQPRPLPAARPCRRCSKQFIPQNGLRAFCSIACRNKAIRARAKVRPRRVLPARVCGSCNHEFTPRRRSQLYCSVACREAANKARLRTDYARVHPRTPQSCRSCDAQFLPAQQSGRYCSSNCRKEAERARSRAKYARLHPARRVSPRKAILGKCYACHRRKPDEAFVRVGEKRRNICKPCANKRGMEWKRKHPEVAQAAARKWRALNPEYRRNYRLAHPEKTKEWARQSYERRSDEKGRAYWNAYYRRFMAHKRSGANPSEALLYELVAKMTADLPDDIREAVQQELFVRVLAREIRRTSLRPYSAAYKKAVTNAWKELGEYGTLSLNRPLGEDTTLTFGDLLVAPHP